MSNLLDPMRKTLCVFLASPRRTFAPAPLFQRSRASGRFMTISRYATYLLGRSLVKDVRRKLPCGALDICRMASRQWLLDNGSGEGYVPDRLIDMPSFRPLRPFDARVRASTYPEQLACLRRRR